MKLRKYTGDKTYMFPNGSVATKERVLEQFPAALDFAFVFQTDDEEECIYTMDALSKLRGMYGISSELTEDEAIAAIEEIINTPAEPVETVTDQTRIADALEDMVVLQELNSVEV